MIYSREAGSPNFQPHHQPFNYYARFAPGTKDRAEHLKDGADLIHDIEAGTLPQVSFYKPVGVLTQHPSYTDLASGDDHVDEILNRLRSSPQWDKMLVIVTQDENGGFWDHVPPPVADQFGPGTRIPTLIISPFAKRGFVDHTAYDTTSILKFVTRRFGLAPLLGLRAPMGDLTNALTFERQAYHTREFGRLDQESIIIIGRVAGALVIGAMIGLERTFHGRPAGFRTHSLVCIASSILMIVTVYQDRWMTFVEHEAIRTDPTRMAQGIMTGIGFLGAGVIFKEGLTVRGLTTAASIWVTAAIGILVGIGFWFAALVGAAATLIVLAVFRVIETHIPSEFYAHHTLRFDRARCLVEADVRKLIGEHGFTVANLSRRLLENGQQFEYRMTIKSRDRGNAESLAGTLRGLPEVLEFRITPTGD